MAKLGDNNDKVLKKGEVVDQEDAVIGGGFSSFDDILDALPDFLKEN